MPSQILLIMRSGPTPGATFVLKDDQITIGRDSTNDIVINDAEINRRHARLTFQAGKHVLEDLGSTNGTFVNGQRLAGPRVLKTGQVLSFGEQIVFVYEVRSISSEGHESTKQNRPRNILIIDSGQQQARLVMRSGPTPGAIFGLEHDQITIGRDSTNAIVINDAEINRRHARLTFQAGKHILEDLGSTNGTFVNGQRLAGPRVLRTGEIVSFGEQIVLVYELSVDKSTGKDSIKIWARLIMRSGPTPGVVYDLARDLVLIGRDSTNEIVVNEAEVSPRHARFTLQGGKYVLENLGYTTATFVNGQRLVGPRILKGGEIISLGKQIVFVYEIPVPNQRKSVEELMPPMEEGLSNKILEYVAPQSTAGEFQEEREQENSVIKKSTSHKTDTKSQMTLSGRVFISYSRKDIGFVQRLAKDLHSNGVDVWWDVSQLRGGDRWKRAIQAAINEREYCLVVLSPDSVKSEWVENEYTYALQKKKKVIPLYLFDCEVPIDLITVQYVDFLENSYGVAIHQLLSALGE